MHRRVKCYETISKLIKVISSIKHLMKTFKKQYLLKYSTVLQISEYSITKYYDYSLLKRHIFF